MNKEDGAKVFSVWSRENSINLPNKKELLLEIIDQVASLFAVGSFYYFILNFENITMDYVHEGIRNVLGIEPEEFSMEKGFEIMHSEDLATMNEKEAVVFDFFFNKISSEDLFNYKSVYVMRMRHTDGTYKTLLHQASVFSVSDDGKIQQTLCVHTDISYLNIPINHTVSFISSKKQCYHYSKKSGNYAIIHKNNSSLEKKSFKDIFTKREQEIVEKLAQGMKFNEIAKELFISPHTINTHKKNMLKKADCKNTPELIARYYIDSLF
ncbi:LuxR C-terminal-related transcriptional regulator [Flavobacterium sp. XS2P12]|uniref:LuxR C-terminal-related transcriptional regulator n=1 Tax=Flavobacterium melibiosi TaxID=3398734 RepID=UPI003A84D016